MREKLTMAFAFMILAVMIPYLGTIVLTGTVGATPVSVMELDTGKTVSLELDGKYVVMDVEAYLAGILPNAMEGSEDPELWKALAVIERTNIYKKMDGMSNIDEKDLGMQYLSENELCSLWGEQKYETYRKRVEQAVMETVGMVLLYDGEYIDALYHKVSIGTTVAAEELFGEDIPYLTEVVSSHDVEAKDYMNVVMIPKSDISELSILESTEHGYVKRVSCNGEELTGEEAKERLGLTSFNYYIEDMGNEYRVVCLGKGHGMGLSLFGAGILADEGKGFEDILNYYYPGTQLTK